MTADLFHLVPKIHYGPGAAGQAGPALAWLGARRVLLVSDPGVLAAGVSDAVVRSLSAAGVEHVLHSDLATNPSEKHVDAAAEAYRDGGCDGLIGVGGGSSLDVAKSAALKAERMIIEDVLRQVHWNRRRAAEQLGVSYKTLLNKIKECGISRN